MYEFYCRVWLRTMKNYLGVKIDETKLQDIFFGNHWDIETFVSYFNKLLMVIARKMLLQISCTQKPQSILLYRRFLSALSIANMRYIGVQILRVKSIIVIYSKFLIIKLIIRLIQKCTLIFFTLLTSWKCMNQHKLLCAKIFYSCE